MTSEHDALFYKLFSELENTLPTFDDGRIDYTDAPQAPVLSVYVIFGGKLLLLKRSEHVGTYKGLWNVVAGYLDERKSISTKALEEIREELSITEVASLKTFAPTTVSDSALGKTWLVFPVVATLNNEPLIELDWEHTASAWVSEAELKTFETVPGLARSAKRYCFARNSPNPE